MTARFAKETRELLPLAGATALLIVTPYFIWRGDAEPFAILIFAVGCAIMGASAFGQELQHRTLALLLAQPVPRPVLWREKMSVLAIGLAAASAALGACLYVYGTKVFCDGNSWVVLPFIPLCAFCSAPCLTLITRSGIAGTALTMIFPGAVLGIVTLAVSYLVPEAWAERLFVTLIGLYCGVAYLLGSRGFRRLQVVDGVGRELRLPVRFESLLERGLGKLPAALPGAFGALVRKELRLQQAALLLAGGGVLAAVIGAVLYKVRSQWAEFILGIDAVVYLAVLPFIVGAVAAAEERFWGVSGWHLTLPVSAFRQWLAKLISTLATSLGLGLLLPAILVGLGWLLLGSPRSGGAFPNAATLALCVLVEWLVVSLAVYTGTFCNSVLKAILVAFAMILAGLLGIKVVFEQFFERFVDALLLKADGTLLGNWVCLGLVVLIVLSQRFAFDNFRRQELPLRRLAGQVASLLVAAILLALVALTNSLR